jgi:predicted NUDIX family NTP pyrophosphohydrolase
MATTSAGLLLYRTTSGHPEVLLVHPGGPYWARKDEGAWSIPKGELEEGEAPLAAARREFAEETGIALEGDPIELGVVRQPGGKVVHAWAVEGDLDPASVRSDTFRIEWPPGSGKQREFPEVDRAAWFTIEAAGRKILKGQVPFLAELQRRLADAEPPPAEPHSETGPLPRQ